VLLAQLLHQRGPLDRRGADDDPFHAGVEELEGGVGAAHSPADFDLAGHAAHDEADLVEMRAFAGARGVEVDHVDPLRPRGFELACHPHRVVVVDRLRGEVALAETHAVSAAQVDGGQQLGHRGLRRRTQSVPLVDGTLVPSIFTASRSARATPLNEASITW
jgi:hypothetical protein